MLRAKKFSPVLIAEFKNKKIPAYLIKQERNTVKWCFPVVSVWESRDRAKPFPYLRILLLCTVQPGVLDLLLLFGHFHDLLKRSVIFTRVFCQEAVQIGECIFIIFFCIS